MKSPLFAASPRATRPTQCEVVEEAVAECVSKPREGVGLRGEWVVPFSSGAGLRAFQRQRVSPAPPRHLARIVPVFVPSKPLARRRGVLGLLSRLYNGSTTTTRAEGLVRYSSQLGG